MKLKILCVGDIHGRHEIISNAFDKYYKEGYNKIIFLGDYADSFTRSNEDIIRCFRLLMDEKEKLKDDQIILIGNHEEHYLYKNQELKCSGYRPDLYGVLHMFLEMNKHKMQYAAGIGNYLFTHAGLQIKWYLKHYVTLRKWADVVGVDMNDMKDHHIVLNAIGNTSDRYILHERGAKRGGYDSNYGGITWCDASEIINFGPVAGLHQVVGHTPQKYIKRQTLFMDRKSYPNTSVSFIDVLDKGEQFLTLNIEV